MYGGIFFFSIGEGYTEKKEKAQISGSLSLWL